MSNDLPPSPHQHHVRTIVDLTEKNKALSKELLEAQAELAELRPHSCHENCDCRFMVMKRELLETKERLEKAVLLAANLTGEKFSERNHTALQSRAVTAELRVGTLEEALIDALDHVRKGYGMVRDLSTKTT